MYTFLCDNHEKRERSYGIWYQYGVYIYIIQSTINHVLEDVTSHEEWWSDDVTRMFCATHHDQCTEHRAHLCEGRPPTSMMIYTVDKCIISSHILMTTHVYICMYMYIALDEHQSQHDVLHGYDSNR